MLAALAVDPVSEPGEERGEVAPGDGRVEAAKVEFGAGVELGGVEVAQGVSGEVTEEAGGPVDVLEAPTGGVGRGDPQVAAIPVVPGLG